MKQRVYILFLLPALIFAYSLSGAGSIKEAVRSRPNVVIILADDMGMGDLGFLNGGTSSTPTLDALARTGIWFSNGYSASPVCAPARAALLTGRIPHRSNVVTLDIMKYPELTTLSSAEVTMAEVFREAGYRTGLVGKWHTSHRPESHPLRAGFEVFEGFIGAREVPSYWEYTLEVEGEKRAFKGPYLTDELTRRAVSFIHQHSEEPFFLFLAHYAPHRPLGAPSELINRYQEAGLDLDTATVYAMIEQMDGGIGRILKALEDLGIRDETIMLFTSDNGPDPLIQERFNAGLRGSKYDVFEGGIRVPFILNWPGQLDVGERAEVIHFVDLLPTLAAFCDITPGMTKELDGRNMAPFIRSGEAPESVDHFWQWNRGAPNYTHNAALRRGNWKLVRPPMTRREPEGNSSLEPALYNLAADPAERINLIGEHQELARALLERLEEVARAVERERESVAADYSGHP